MSRRISFRPLIFLVLCLLVVMYLARTMSRQGDITYSAMRENFVQEKVQSFTVSDSRLTATLKDQTTVTCPIRDFTLFYDDLNDLVVEQYSKGIITQYDYPAAPGTNWLQVLLPYVLAIMAFILLMNLMTRMNGSGAGGVSDKMAHFGEARVSSIPEGDKKVTFKDDLEVMMPCPPMQLTEYATRPYTSAGRLGADTDSIFHDLGYTDSEIAAMKGSGAIQ